MAKVPLRSGLLADVSNSDSDHAAMKSFFTKSAEQSSSFGSDDQSTFSPRTDLANKLSHTSLICNEQAESDVSNSPPLCTPNRKVGCNDIKNKRNVGANIGRMSPLVIADEQTKFPELEDNLSQKSVEAAWGRRRSCTFTELSTDSGFGSSSMQSWADSSQRSGVSTSFSPSSLRTLGVISESSNFAFSPSAFSSISQETSRDSFATNGSPCPSTPQHRVMALRSRSSRSSPLTPKHCSPSPSLPKHIQALVRGGISSSKGESCSATTSPTAIRKPLGKQSLFATAIANEQQRSSSERLQRTSSLKRVATSECMDVCSQPSQPRSQPFSPFEAKKLKSQLESIKEGAISASHRSSLSHSQSSYALSTLVQQSVEVVEKPTSTTSVVTVTKTSPEAATCHHQAPPDTCLVGDGSRPYLLPCRPHESTVLIECSELAKLLKGKYSSEVRDFHIIDCRYPYEHTGGHIRGAVNHPKAEPLLKKFFEVPQQATETGRGKRTLLIFHCEFSSKRAPDMLKAFRKCDRDRNRNSYPKLDYPEVYMLEGGYKAFFEYCRDTNQLELLEPHGGYTPMHAEEHNQELRKWKKYKTMSAVEERLVKTGQSVLSPLSTSCGATSDDSNSSTAFSLSQQEPTGSGGDENGRKVRVARRPLVRRQLSSFSVPHSQSSSTSPHASSKFVDKATPLGSHTFNPEQRQVDAENVPPSDW